MWSGKSFDRMLGSASSVYGKYATSLSVSFWPLVQDFYVFKRAAFDSQPADTHGEIRLVCLRPVAICSTW